MKDDKEKSDILDAIDAVKDGIEKANEWADENSGVIDGIFGGVKQIDLSSPEPLTEVHTTEDKVLIVAEVEESKVGKMAVDFYNGFIKVNVGGQKFKAKVPDDVVEDSLEATMKNGVLRATIDRQTVNRRDFLNSIEHEPETVIERDDVDIPVKEEETEEDNGGDDDGVDE